MKAETTAVNSKPFFIEPRPGYLICKSYKENKVAGFSIADTMADRDSAGEVVAVGEGYRDYKPDGTPIVVTATVEIGDIIIFKNYGTNRFMDFNTGEPLFWVKFHNDPNKSDILGKIRQEKEKN